METCLSASATIATVAGLNRTMQYGNWDITMDKKTIVIRLNRTMQYGNV